MGPTLKEQLKQQQKETLFDNDGNIRTNNRETRRKFPPSNPDDTKSTWARQSRKELKRKRKLGRK